MGNVSEIKFARIFLFSSLFGEPMRISVCEGDGPWSFFIGWMSNWPAPDQESLMGDSPAAAKPLSLQPVCSIELHFFLNKVNYFPYLASSLLNNLMPKTNAFSCLAGVLQNGIFTDISKYPCLFHCSLEHCVCQFKYFNVCSLNL